MFMNMTVLFELFTAIFPQLVVKRKNGFYLTDLFVAPGFFFKPAN